MINRINPIVNQINITRPTFKSNSDEKELFVTQPKPEVDGIEALANYGIASIKMFKEFKMIPTQPIEQTPYVTDSINGERIYTSDGKLYSIVDENEETKTTYIIDNDINNAYISKITILNKESGQKIKEQENYFDIEDGELELNELAVTEYSFSTGKPIRSSVYSDGKLASSTNYIKKKNGMDETVTYYYKDKNYFVFQTSPNNDYDAHFEISKDLKFVEMDLTKTGKNSEKSFNLEFYNGALISASERKKKTIPNLMGREPLNDNDLIPAKKYNISIITPDFEGEKTYYSNGAVESIKTTDGTAYFTPEGQVQKLASKNMEIYAFNNGNMLIIEKLEDDKIRFTRYSEDVIDVSFSDGDKYKNLSLTSKMVPTRYEEGICDDEDSNEDSRLVFYYDKTGFLDTAYNF